MDLFEASQRFMNHEPIPGVSFEHNDYVRIVSGDHADKCESVVVLARMDPEPTFIVEVESNGDVEARQSELRHEES